MGELKLQVASQLRTSNVPPDRKKDLMGCDRLEGSTDDLVLTGSDLGMLKYGWRRGTSKTILGCWGAGVGTRPWDQAMGSHPVAETERVAWETLLQLPMLMFCCASPTSKVPPRTTDAPPLFWPVLLGEPQRLPTESWVSQESISVWHQVRLTIGGGSRKILWQFKPTMRENHTPTARASDDEAHLRAK